MEVGWRVVSLTVCLPHSQRCELKLHPAERTATSLRKESPCCRARFWTKCSRHRPRGPESRHQLVAALSRRTTSVVPRQPSCANRTPPRESHRKYQRLASPPRAPRRCIPGRAPLSPRQTGSRGVRVVRFCTTTAAVCEAGPGRKVYACLIYFNNDG
jgi:hypothetical protein